MSDPQRIYFIKPVGMDGPIKIGCSSWPEERLRQMFTWSPFPLEIIHSCLGGFDIERKIHHSFADLHSHREWFRPGERLIAAIQDLKSGLPVDVAIDLAADNGSIRKGQWGKKNIPAELVGFRSYASRFRHAEKRASDQAQERRVFPDDVRDILVKWEGRNGYRRPRRSVRPSISEFERLEEVLKDPFRHCVRPNWLKRSEAA